MTPRRVQWLCLAVLALIGLGVAGYLVLRRDEPTVTVVNNTGTPMDDVIVEWGGRRYSFASVRGTETSRGESARPVRPGSPEGLVVRFDGAGGEPRQVTDRNAEFDLGYTALVLTFAPAPDGRPGCQVLLTRDDLFGSRRSVFAIQP